MLVARISRPDALYGASFASRTFGDFASFARKSGIEEKSYEMVSETIGDFPNSVENADLSHIPGFGVFLNSKHQNANKANLL